MSELTQDVLKQLLNYNEDTGIFTWIVDIHGRKMIGKSAGTNKLGYLSISINRRIYQAHRLAWLYTYGRWPEHLIDHINTDRSDNRISNLRECNVSQNAMNRGTPSTNKSGYKGVFWHKRDRKWQARAMVSGKQYHIGNFDSIDEAKNAYDNFAEERFGKFYKNPY